MMGMFQLLEYLESNLKVDTNLKMIEIFLYGRINDVIIRRAINIFNEIHSIEPNY